MDLFYEKQWNPWRAEELTPAMDRAHEVIAEWTRAEPDHRMMTDEEVQAWLKEMRREDEARQRADEERYAAQAESFDPERERARYALLEIEAGLIRKVGRLDALREGSCGATMAPDHRTREMAELDRAILAAEASVTALIEIVGDREDVVDAGGYRPADRRPLQLVGYGCTRHFDVEDLQTSTARLREQVAASTARDEKRALGLKLESKQRRLDALLAVPRLTANDMCADCETPIAAHLAVDDQHQPCPYWPMHAARMERVWSILRSVSSGAQESAPEPPKPQPLATLPAKLPIVEVIARLQLLQEQHPDAVVRRGRANRWELWRPEGGAP